MKNETAQKKKADKSLPRKATQSHLDNAALYYVERFSCTADSLRQMLTRRVHRSSHYHDTDIDEGLGWVADIIERFVRSGLIDDRTFANARARSLHQRGNSAKIIRMKLMAKGVSGEIIDDALQSLDADEGDGEPGDAERNAAHRLARRRRLGPYADPIKRAELREKHLAALARSGFSYDTALEVIDADEPKDFL